MLRYFIGYTQYVPNSGSFVGRCSIERTHPIVSIGDIASIEATIAEQRKEEGTLGPVLVTNWQRMEETLDAKTD